MDAASLQSEQPLCSPDLRSPRSVDSNEISQIHPKDSAKSLGKGPEKDGQEAQSLKSIRRPLRRPAKAMADAHQSRHLHAPEVEECYYQINWPQAVLQKWAMAKEDREKNLCQDACQETDAIRSITSDQAPGGQAFGCGVPEGKKGTPGIPLKQNPNVDV